MSMFTFTKDHTLHLRVALVAGSALVLGLTACNKPGMQDPKAQQYQQQMAQNDPYAQAPAPYNQYNPNTQQPSAWPGANNQAPNTGPVSAAPGNRVPGSTPDSIPGPMPGPMPGMNPNGIPAPMQGNGQPLKLSSAPQGMTALRSQAGNVFRANLSGNAPVPQQSRDFYMKLMPYFDSQPQVLGYMDDPSGRMAQVGFQSTKNGAPVMGMMIVSQGQNGAVAVVMLDSPERFQSSMQAMNAAAQQ